MRFSIPGAIPIMPGLIPGGIPGSRKISLDNGRVLGYITVMDQMRRDEERNTRETETMTRDETVVYVGVDGQTYDGQIERDLAVIEFAEDRGFYYDPFEGIAVETAAARIGGIGGYEDYPDLTGMKDQGDLGKDLRRIANDAVSWLNDQGLLPQGYGYDDERDTDGYGTVDTRAGARG